MTKKEAMEWADKVYSLDITDKEGIAELFMEATEGLYRIGESVQWKWGALDNAHGEWQEGVVSVAGVMTTSLPFVVRPLPTKRPKTKRELAEDIGWWAEDVSFETYQRMATDLGISLEVKE